MSKRPVTKEDIKNKIQRDQDKKRVEAYLEDIKEVDKKHGLTFTARLDFQAGGITPKLSVSELVTPKQKEDESNKN